LLIYQKGVLPEQRIGDILIPKSSDFKKLSLCDLQRFSLYYSNLYKKDLLLKTPDKNYNYSSNLFKGKV